LRFFSALSAFFSAVTADKKRWKARINYGGKQHRLGTFATKQEAALKYDRAARQCGEAKPLNYQSIVAAEEAAQQARQAAEEAAQQARQAAPQKPRPPSGYYGVIAIGNRWVARISYGSKYHHLGTFANKQEAALEYDRAARQQCGKARPLNYESTASS
jgi:hypothetical protein